MQWVSAWLLRKDLIYLVFNASASRKGTLSWGSNLLCSTRQKSLTGNISSGTCCDFSFKLLGNPHFLKWIFSRYKSAEVIHSRVFVPAFWERAPLWVKILHVLKFWVQRPSQGNRVGRKSVPAKAMRVNTQSNPCPWHPAWSSISQYSHHFQPCRGTRAGLEAAVLGLLAAPGGCWIPICSSICFNTFAFLPSVYGKFEGI